jgi:hypothetical protein
MRINDIYSIALNRFAAGSEDWQQPLDGQSAANILSYFGSQDRFNLSPSDTVGRVG